MKLGDKIKKLRELKNYTQQYLADELGISLSGYGKIERDQTEITLSRLMQIAEILDVDLFTLIQFNGDSFFKSTKNSSSNSDLDGVKVSYSDWANELIEKYKEENGYLKELVRQLMEKR